MVVLQNDIELVSTRQRARRIGNKINGYESFFKSTD